ncbi:MAG: glycosyltransferase family 9 protein [Planctomycetota bacterium]
MQRLQRADQVLGLAACAVLRPFHFLWRLVPRRAREERVLLVKFWGIGSLQLLTPAVESLRRRYPSASLELLTLRQNGDFARGLRVFDAVHELDVESPSWAAIFGRVARVLHTLRRRRFRAVYDFEFFTRFSALVTALLGAPLRVGFESPRVWRGGFHNATAPFNRYWHVARNFRCLAGGENGRDVAAEDLAPFRVTDAARARVEALLGEQELGGPGPLVVLNPNAGTLSLERRWPPQHFADLATRFARDMGARIALVGSRGEREWTGEVLARVGPECSRVANLAGRLDVDELCALLERADLFVGNDSGPMHLAAALGAPTVGLFGPETPVMYAPLGRRTRALYKPPACSPCINVHDNKLSACWRGRPECLLNLGVDLVEAAARQMVEGDARSVEKEVAR